MAANGEKISETGPASWPTPDDPKFAHAGEATRRWLESTQPEALAAQLTDTIKTTFQAMSRLAMFYECYPEDAFTNAMTQLPAEHAQLMAEQLEFMRAFAKDQHAARGAEGTLESRLCELAMKAAGLPNPTE